MEGYKKLVIELEKKMSNRELLEEILELSWKANSDPYDQYTKWEYGYLRSRLFIRLGNWLND